MTTNEEKGATRVRAVFPLTRSLRVDWTEALPDHEPAEPPLQRRCRVAQLLSVGGGLLRLDAVLTFSVLQGRMDRFEVELPAETTLVGVEGAGVREHRIVKPDGRASVSVYLSRPVSGEVSFSLHAEKSLDGA